MVSKVISDLINMSVVSIYKAPVDKDMLIYLSDTGELFNTKTYQGYLRLTKTSYFTVKEMPSRQFARNNYKLVLFFGKKTCDSVVNNVIANLWLDVARENIIKITPTESYQDSWDNIKKELNKDKYYVDYRVVVVDLESEEIICKTKIECNE